MQMPVAYWVKWYDKAIWHYAYRSEIGIWEAEDIRQEVLVHLATTEFKRSPVYSLIHGVKLTIHPSHVMTEIRRKSQKIVRAESIRLKAGDVDPRTLSTGWGPVEHAALLEAIHSMSTRQKQAIVAKVRGSGSIRSVAQQIHSSAATACRELRQARGRLEIALLAETSPRRTGVVARRKA